MWLIHRFSITNSVKKYNLMILICFFRLITTRAKDYGHILDICKLFIDDNQ